MRTYLINREILKTDRIVKINEFNLRVIKNFRPDRRNIVCQSEMLKELNLAENEVEIVENMLRRGEITDIQMVGVVGFH